MEMPPNYSIDVNFCKDHHDKIEVPDPLAVEDLISGKLDSKRKLARLITQYRDIFFPIYPSSGCYSLSNISEGTAFLLQGVTFSVTHSWRQRGRVVRAPEVAVQVPL